MTNSLKVSEVILTGIHAHLWAYTYIIQFILFIRVDLPVYHQTLFQPPRYIVWVPSPHYIERVPTCFSDTVPPPPLSSCCCRRFFISVSFITCWFSPLLLTSSSWRWFSLCSKRAFTFPTSSYKITPPWQCVKSSKKHKYHIFFRR